MLRPVIERRRRKRRRRRRRRRRRIRKRSRSRGMRKRSRRNSSRYKEGEAKRSGYAPTESVLLKLFSYSKYPGGRIVAL